jgi:hypothetical protein
MNPFNVAWIVLTWFLAADAFFGYFAGDHRIALVAVVVMAVLITGQTVGVDHAERVTGEPTDERQPYGSRLIGERETMKFKPHPGYFNRTGHYASGPYSIHNTATKAWELHVNGALLDTLGSFKSAKAAAERHYDSGGLRRTT